MKNHVYLYLVLAGLFIAFGAISLGVYFTGGKNKYFLKKKLAIGAIIIGLTAVSNGCRPVVTCYDVAPSPEMTCVDSVSEAGTIVLNKNNSLISFNCEYMFYNDISYRIYKEEVKICEDSCKLLSQEQSSRLEMNVVEELLPGNYSLRFYYFKLDELTKDSYAFEKFDLKIID
jgi:hypothetical protein